MFWLTLGGLLAWTIGGLGFIVGMFVYIDDKHLRRLRQFWVAVIIIIGGPVIWVGGIYQGIKTKTLREDWGKIFRALFSPVKFLFFKDKEASEQSTSPEEVVDSVQRTIAPIVAEPTTTVRRNIKVDIVSTKRKSWFNFKK